MPFADLIKLDDIRVTKSTLNQAIWPIDQEHAESLNRRKISSSYRSNISW